MDHVGVAEHQSDESPDNGAVAKEGKDMQGNIPERHRRLLTNSDTEQAI